MNPSWTDFEKYVFEQLEKIKGDISGLKSSAAVSGAGWGFLAGMVPVVIGLLIQRALH